MAYLLLILLTVVVNTFSGELPPIARANSRDTTPVPSGIGCIQFNKHSETCKTDGTRPCTQFNVQTGQCLPGRFSTDTTLGGCLDWNYDTDGYCNEFVIKNATPTCPKNDFDPSGTSGTDCGDGINEPTCSNPNYHYDPDFGVCVQDSPSPTTGSSSPASPGTPLIPPCPVDHIKPILPCPENPGSFSPISPGTPLILPCPVDHIKLILPCLTNSGTSTPNGNDPKTIYLACHIDTSTNVITPSGTTSCYYPLPAGGSCNLNEADSKGTNQPYPQYNECVFTPAGGTIPSTGPSTGPSSGPPPTSTQCPKGYSPVKSGPNLGMCELASDTDPTHTASMIGATCQTGYAYSQTGLDASTGTCLPILGRCLYRPE
jgi:hypothetical protein